MQRDLLRQHNIAVPDIKVEVVITAKTEQKQNSPEIAAMLCRWHEATILKYLGREVRKDKIIFHGAYTKKNGSISTESSQIELALD